MRFPGNSQEHLSNRELAIFTSDCTFGLQRVQLLQIYALDGAAHAAAPPRVPVVVVIVVVVAREGPLDDGLGLAVQADERRV